MNKFEYLVIIRRVDGYSNYYGSCSRNSAIHLKKSGGTACWVYDSQGRRVSFAMKNKITGKITRHRVAENKIVPQYIEILKGLNK